MHNKEELAELAAEQQRQEEMMQSIISAGKLINRSTQSIKGTVGEVSEATNNVAQSMCDVSAGMENTVSSIQEQTVMTERIQGIIKDTVDIAGRLETIAVQSDKDVMVGQQLVEEVVSGTNGMESESRAVRENMGELHEHTKDMEKIVSIINEISSRTSLLSINASIEAAMAMGNSGI